MRKLGYTATTHRLFSLTRIALTDDVNVLKAKVRDVMQLERVGVMTTIYRKTEKCMDPYWYFGVDAFGVFDIGVHRFQSSSIASRALVERWRKCESMGGKYE